MMKHMKNFGSKVINKRGELFRKCLHRFKHCLGNIDSFENMNIQQEDQTISNSQEDHNFDSNSSSNVPALGSTRSGRKFRNGEKPPWLHIFLLIPYNDLQSLNISFVKTSRYGEKPPWLHILLLIPYNDLQSLNISFVKTSRYILWYNLKNICPTQKSFSVYWWMVDKKQAV